MTISVSCDACGKSYRIPEDKAGRRFRCKACGETIMVPELEYEDEWDDEEYDDDEWGESDDYGEDLNPYAAPTSRSGSRSRKRGGAGNRSQAKSRLIAPAICLYIVAGLSSLNHVGGIVLAATGNAPVFPAHNLGQPGGAQAEAARLVGGIVGGVVGLVIDIFVIIGAYNMQSLKSHGLAMTGAIMACIPCCGPCVVLGIPFGIWSLVVLNDSSVKSSFG
jgi:predicted Zn finger-like uncharacterized protein